MRKGDKGPYVEELQGDLVQLGYDIGTYGPNKDGIDGSFGAKTEAAVKAFQKTRGLTADGNVGEKTWDALDAAVGPEPGPAPEPALYTVTIPGVDEAEADKLISQYPGATKAEERR